jgi:hypothetical protein
VVDAAGAIYVIGGSGGTYYHDVWVSTDGGARAGLRREGGRGVHSVGCYRGEYSSWVLRGTKGYKGVV